MQRKVPWANDSDDPNRFAIDKALFAWGVRRANLTVNPTWEACGLQGNGPSTAPLYHGFHSRAARLFDQPIDDLLLALIEDIDHVIQHLCPLCWGFLCPVNLSGLGRGKSFIELLFIGLFNLHQPLTIIRISIGIDAIILTRLPITGDIV